MILIRGNPVVSISRVMICQKTYKNKIPVKPLRIPIEITEIRTNASTLRGKVLATIKSDGRLRAGRVSNKAAAGPDPSPKDRKDCRIGISAAVGMTNRAPATAKKTMAQKPLPIWAGNNQVCKAPSSKTEIK